MVDQEVAIKLNSHDHEISSLKHRVKECEQQQSIINKLVNSVDKLATNMENMIEEQKTQRCDINELKQAPAEDFKYYKRLVIGCILTGVIGTVLGAMLTLVMRGG